jgi:hypothetical protein
MLHKDKKQNPLVFTVTIVLKKIRLFKEALPPGTFRETGPLFHQNFSFL